jgi:hypothetical protein
VADLIPPTRDDCRIKIRRRVAAAREHAGVLREQVGILGREAAGETEAIPKRDERIRARLRGPGAYRKRCSRPLSGGR